MNIHNPRTTKVYVIIMSTISPPTGKDFKEPQPLTQREIEQCTNDLKTFYQESLRNIKADPMGLTDAFEFEKIYTNLSMVIEDESGQRRKVPIDYSALLTTPVHGLLPRRLLVEGEGGSGKTTFCSKIAWDWTSGTRFQEFTMVLLIPLRDTEDNDTVGEILKRYLPEDNLVQSRRIDEYIRTNPDKVFLILDGLDEYNGDLSHAHSIDIVQILRSDRLRTCTVLVTTRSWKADQVKLQQNLMRSYAFIYVEGFSRDNLSVYILRFFGSDEVAGQDLITFIEDTDVIRENMAPYPIYTAMLCVMWRESDRERRETIRSLQTFSQVFKEMIRFLVNHLISKKTTDPREKAEQAKAIEEHLLLVGVVAFLGLLQKQLLFLENDFTMCHEAMKTACKVGVLTRQKEFVPLRTASSSLQVASKVLFPHKLFQEFVSAMYLARLLDRNPTEFYRLINEKIIPKAYEFRYLLYFTTSQNGTVGSAILSKLTQIKFERTHYNEDKIRSWHSFLVDVAFECHDGDACRSVGRSIFDEEKTLQIDEQMLAHTVSGYFFIMEKNAMVKIIRILLNVLNRLLTSYFQIPCNYCNINKSSLF